MFFIRSQDVVKTTKLSQVVIYKMLKSVTIELEFKKKSVHWL